MPPLALALLAAAAGLLLLLALAHALSSWPFASRPVSLEKAHALVTGGSSGIGLEVAKELARRGVRAISLVARDARKLAQAKEVVEAEAGGEVAVDAISVDVTDAKQVQKAVDDAAKKHGAPAVVVCAAGAARPKAFEDATVEDFHDTMALNFFGAVHVAKVRATRPRASRDHKSPQLTPARERQAAVPLLKQHPRSRLLFVSSMAGQVGIYGYTSYAPSKYALRGFAEALAMELTHLGVRVTVAYPPDTDTPGLAQENATKPPETVKLSEGSGLWKSDVVARQLVDGMAAGKVSVNYGIDGLMLGTLTVGMGRASSAFDAIKEVALMSILRAVALAYVTSFYATVRSMAYQRAKSS